MVALFAIAACASTEQARSVTPSGFLGDYSKLQAGRGDQALLLYINPGANFSGYEKVIVDPVTIWYHEDSNLSNVPPAELQGLADYLDNSLREHLGREFAIVEDPAPGTLRVRAAITDAKGSRVALDIASTVLPPALLISEVTRLARGTHAFVGRAAIEVEILDASSDERLIAAADKRAGSKVLQGSTDTWNAVENAFDYWADVMRERLALFREIDRAEPAEAAE